MCCVHQPNQLVWHSQCGSLILSSPCLPPLANQIWLPQGLMAPSFQLILQNISIKVLQNNYVMHLLAEHLQMTVREEMQDHSSLSPPVGFYSWGDWQNTWHLDSVCSDSGTDFIRNSKMLTCQSALFCLCNQFRPWRILLQKGFKVVVFLFLIWLFVCWLLDFDNVRLLF